MTDERGTVSEKAPVEDAVAVTDGPLLWRATTLIVLPLAPGARVPLITVVGTAAEALPATAIRRTEDVSDTNLSVRMP